MVGLAVRRMQFCMVRPLDVQIIHDSSCGIVIILCPRLPHSLGCIPVVIMDEVHAVFESILDWASFSIRIKVEYCSKC